MRVILVQDPHAAAGCRGTEDARAAIRALEQAKTEFSHTGTVWFASKDFCQVPYGQQEFPHVQGHLLTPSFGPCFQTAKMQMAKHL